MTRAERVRATLARWAADRRELAAAQEALEAVPVPPDRSETPAYWQANDRVIEAECRLPWWLRGPAGAPPSWVPVLALLVALAVLIVSVAH
jgi:anti-sigma factor RsiW